MFFLCWSSGVDGGPTLKETLGQWLMFSGLCMVTTLVQRRPTIRHVLIQQTHDVESMLVQRWSNVYDAGPTLNQHRFNVGPIAFAGKILLVPRVPDGLYGPIVARNWVRILAVGFLSSGLCLYSAPNCSKTWSVQCFLWYCALWHLEVIRKE